MARVAIVGSRKLPAEWARSVIFNGVASTPLNDVIVSGGARGPMNPRTATVSADREAERAAAFYRREFVEMPADWGKGRGAGFARNVDIVRALNGPGDRLNALWDGVSQGTRHVIDVAAAACVLRRIFRSP